MAKHRGESRGAEIPIHIQWARCRCCVSVRMREMRRDDLRGEVLGVGWCGCGIEDEHATDLEGQAAGCGNRMSNDASGEN
jgi:hypothetical protein